MSESDEIYNLPLYQKAEQIFQLTQLVTAQRQRRDVVALNVNVASGEFRETMKFLQRRRAA